MAEIAALPWNGINVISTFSGCGGSSLGYRMAGCRVLGASEFVPAAYEVYRQNARPGTVLWTEDIRTLNPLQMLNDVGLEPGQLDILDGSPPCAAFSTAGKRSDGWGVVKQYSDTRQRVDDLFYEFARVLEIMQPRAFVAENVEGLVKGVAKGYFKAIHQRLVDCGYVVRAAVLDASWLGVPQRRRRIIFIGIRNDLGVAPVHPSPLPYQYAMRDALPYLAGQVKEGTGSGWDTQPGWADAHSAPSATIGASLYTGNGRFPAFAVADLVIKPWAGNSPPVTSIDTVSPTVTATGMWGVTSGEVAFASDALYVRDYGKQTMTAHSIDNPSPIVMAHGIGAVTRESAVFDVTGRPDAALTDPETGQDLLRISALLTAKYPDRKLRRLTIAELRRLCSFPDDFMLSGSYLQRWERLGRSVPPVMMKHIATAVVETLCAAS